MAYIASTPVPQTDESVGRRHDFEWTRNSSDLSSSVMAQAGKLQLLSPSVIDQELIHASFSVYHGHRSFMLNRLLGLTHFRCRDRC